MKTAKKGYLRVEEAAKMLDKTVKYLSNDRQKYNKIPYIREGKYVLYHKDDIENIRQKLEAKQAKKLGVTPELPAELPKEDALPSTVSVSFYDKPKAKQESKVIYVEGGYLKDGVIKLGTPESSPTVAEVTEVPSIASSPVPKVPLHLKSVPLPNQGIESFKIKKIPKDNLANAMRPHISALHVSNHKIKEEIAYLHHTIETLRAETKESSARIYKLEQALESMKAESNKGWVIRLCRD